MYLDVYQIHTHTHTHTQIHNTQPRNQNTINDESKEACLGRVDRQDFHPPPVTQRGFLGDCSQRVPIPSPMGPSYITTTAMRMSGLSHRLGVVVQLLKKKLNESTCVNTSGGCVNNAVGRHACDYINLIILYLRSRTDDVARELESLGVVPLLVDTFLNRGWNSFLHNYIKMFLVELVEMSLVTPRLTIHFIRDTLFIQRSSVILLQTAKLSQKERGRQSQECMVGHIPHITIVLGTLAQCATFPGLGWLQVELANIREFGAIQQHLQQWHMRATRSQ
eukprot:GHVR01121601.1.p1 GENE.GHVR01121601.1~~GHVR01121601.1.p1  ORF type:complete len:278 (+),score=72.07 GHVR01121601.1:10-843(+)